MAPVWIALTLVAPRPVADLERGHRAFRAGEYREAAKALAATPARLPRNRDYVLYLLAESEFYAGVPRQARARFAELAKERGSRFAAVAPWRAADCLWAEGRKAEAASAYRRLLKAAPQEVGVDPVPARFRVAEQTSDADERVRLLRRIYLESPAHPLADEAVRRTGGGGYAIAVPATPQERLERARRLAEAKQYEAALAELEKLPADLPAEQRVERDFEAGMAKYRMRRDYPRAAALLLGVALHLQGERGAFAAFHGARALSRADRDDEAISGYRKVVERFPRSRWAAEAQFLSGWLEFNRGGYRESLPGLRATIERYGRSPFANDAAWYLALAHHLLGKPDLALTALGEYTRLSGADADAGRRSSYWRGRLLALLGRLEEAKAAWRALIERAPLSYYGLLARVRLRAAGEPGESPFRQRDVALPVIKQAALREPAVVRADELLRAGMAVEAGIELQRQEQTLGKRLGRDQALALLLDRYPRMQAFRRAYQLVKGRGDAGLAVAPIGAARVFWEAAYPRAFRELVEKYGPPSGNPDLFLYAIMHKESGFGPHVVSYADARGLLQVIPALGEQVAAAAGLQFFADELYDSETNIRIGAAHIGVLVKKFRGQVLLAAGAFNGGTGPMMRWLDRHGRRPLDEFVELVTYKQTREYIKRVLGIYARYLYLYKGEVFDLPLTLDPTYN